MIKNCFRRRAVLPFLTVVFLSLAGCGCSAPDAGMGSAGGSIALLTWNVHNLFDGNDNGYEYDEYRESAGWSTEKYLGRVNAISAAIGSIDPTPDIILLQELESLLILEDIAKSLNGNYFWCHFGDNFGASLGIGVISRLPLLDAKAHSITVGGDTTPRPALEIRACYKKEDFIIFNCHWKSKIGGEDETENIRMASARVIARRISEIWKEEPGTGIIVAGDLNENHDEFYRRGADCIRALLPDDPYCARLSGCIGEDGGDIAGARKDFIVISKNRPPSPVHFPMGTVTMYSPWISEIANGSYFYQHDWETIDHFLISDQFFNNAGWEYEKTLVINNPGFVNANGIPVPYNPKTGAGLSDHLPLLLILKAARD